MQPALIGGLIIGVLWAVPLLKLVNLCCCIGVLIGGAVAAYMLIKRSPVLPVSTGDGAVVGVLAGLIGAAIDLVLGVPIEILFNQVTVNALRGLMDSISDPEVRRAMEQAINNAQDQPFAARLVSALVGWAIVSVLTVGFAALGGVIGVAMFEKRKGNPPYPMQPPTGYPPPGYPQGGGYPPPPPPSPPYGSGPSNT